MNTPNPLVPQGSLNETKNKSHIRIAVCTILAIHVVVIVGLLIAGCKKDGAIADNQKQTNSPPVFDPSTIAQDTNAVAPSNPSQSPSNQVAVTPSTPLNQPPAEQPAPATTEYTVAKGDSFYTIGKKQGVTIKTITAANPGVESTKLKVGQKLQIPARTTVAAATGGGAVAPDSTGASGAGAEGLYVVKSGDNLTKIAKAHGTTPKQLRAANSLKTDQIKVGQKLKLPQKAAPGATAGSTASAAPVPTNTATTSASVQ